MTKHTDDTYPREAFSGFSRFLNGLTGGDSMVTYSAWSHYLVAHGTDERERRCGRIRSAVIDTFAGKGHCEKYYRFHLKRKLFFALLSDEEKREWRADCA